VCAQNRSKWLHAIKPREHGKRDMQPSDMGNNGHGEQRTLNGAVVVLLTYLFFMEMFLKNNLYSPQRL